MEVLVSFNLGNNNYSRIIPMDISVSIPWIKIVIVASFSLVYVIMRYHFNDGEKKPCIGPGLILSLEGGIILASVKLTVEP